jgi:CHAD domain-containing protein
VFRELTDPHWADHLAEELKWLAGKLGDVRDVDVLIARIEADAESDTLDALSPLLATLRDRHVRASESLLEALGGERYECLVRDLPDSIDRIPLADDAWEPCRTALPPLVRETWRRVKRAGRALKLEDPDEEFHEVRKRAKAARYAAEAVREALDDEASASASRFARRAKAVQDILGTHQDAVVLAAEIRKSAADHPDLGPFNFAAGRLEQQERFAAAADRARFFEVWHEFDSKRVLQWLKS